MPDLPIIPENVEVTGDATISHSAILPASLRSPPNQKRLHRDAKQNRPPTEEFQVHPELDAADALFKLRAATFFRPIATKRRLDMSQ